MKRASIISIVLLLSTALFAQVRGVPASVTSYAPGRGMAPGVPASVTSLGPNGYNSVCNQPGCGNSFFFYPLGTTPATIAQPGRGNHHHGGNGGGHHHGNGATGSYGNGYVYVPYAVPVPVEAETDESPQAGQEPEPPAPTVFERRPVVQPAPYAETRRPSITEDAANTEPQHHNMSPVSDEKIPVVIVYKDGRQQEIGNGNYAIVGEMLYDLSGPIAHKVKLADLDLQRTVQLNEQRGVEFSLPLAYKPPA